MVHRFPDLFPKKAVENSQVHDHAGLRIDLTPDGDLDAIVVAVARRPRAGAERGLVAGSVPFGAVIPVSGRKLHGTRKTRSVHAVR